MTVRIYPRTAAPTPGEVLRTNLATTPRGVTSSAVAAGAYYEGGSGSWARNTGAAPDGRAGFARFTRTATGTGTTRVEYREPAPLPAPVAGAVAYMVSAYVRSSVALPSAHVSVPLDFDGFWFPADLGAVALTPGTWARVSGLVDDSYAGGATSLGIGINVTSSELSVGATLDIACVLIEAVPSLGAYFDGGTPDDIPAVMYDWTALADLSSSRASVPIVPGITTELALEYNGTEDTRTELLAVLGRLDPIAVLGPGGLRAGRVELWFPDHATALAAQRLHRGVVMRYEDTEYLELGMDYVATSTNLTPEPYQTKVRRWRLAIDYAEVSAL